MLVTAFDDSNSCIKKSKRQLNAGLYGHCPLVFNLPNRWFISLQGADKDDIVFGVREPQPLERASIRVVPLDRDTIKEFFPSLKVSSKFR